MKKEEISNKTKAQEEKLSVEKIRDVKLDQEDLIESNREVIDPQDSLQESAITDKKLHDGFDFDRDEGRVGDETEDTGDLSAVQKKSNNAFHASLENGRKESKKPIDQQLHISDKDHIGMAYGEDDYESDKPQKNKPKQTDE